MQTFPQLLRKTGAVQIVSEQNQSAMPLHFTLLFPSGTKGWHPDLKKSPGSDKRLTTRDFALFHLAWRKEGTVEGVENFNLIHYGTRLFQEFMNTSVHKWYLLLILRYFITSYIINDNMLLLLLLCDTSYILAWSI